MILAEISEKLVPSSLYICAAVLAGVCAASAVTFLRGIPRIIVFAFVTVLTIILAYTLQVDSDLVDAAQNESGQSYLILSKYWILGSVLLAFVLSLIFRGGSHSRESSQNRQADTQ